MLLSERFLNQQRLQGDEAADQLIADIFSTGQQPLLYQLLNLEVTEVKKQSRSSIKMFLTSKKKKPDWYDRKKLQNGQQLFKHFSLEIMALLGVMSLPYCYAASPGNKALFLSDKMRNSPGKRLIDTASFVIEVLTPESLNDEGWGHIHINKVRLIHALSRHYIKRHPEWNQKYGLPINQEDMAGTNLAFSYIILVGLQQSGYLLSQQEKEDFLFTWRYIGYLLSIHEDLLPTSFAEAYSLEATIRQRNFKKTEEGKILTAELLRYYSGMLPTWQAELVPSQVRFFIGHEAAEYLGLIPDPIRDRIAPSFITLKSLQNMLLVKRSRYQNMLQQHSLLKRNLLGNQLKNVVGK